MGESAQATPGKRSLEQGEGSMFRTLIIGILLATTAPALARVGPEIAYSTATEVYLINPNGSGKIRLYRSKSNDFISSVSLKPGGGSIAFVENWAIKFMDYNASGQQVGTIRTIRPSCYRLADVHYHPDGNSVLYQELCGQSRDVKQVVVPPNATVSPTPTTLLSEPNLIDLGSWDTSGRSFVYTLSTATQFELRRHYVDGTPDPGSLATEQTLQLRYPDISNSGTKILFSNSALAAGAYPGPGYTSEVDASGSPLRSNFITGRKARYAPGDLRIVFIAQQSYNETYLRYLDTDGLPKQIGGREKYSSVDWGN